MSLFRRRVDVQAPTAVTVPVYGPDARGAALFHGITNQNAANLNSAVRIDARGSAWGGWTQAPQVVRSAGLGAGRPVVGVGGTIDEERGISSTSVQQIFEQLMAARRL
jgi:hypothetical protein